MIARTCHPRWWTTGEDRILREHYPTEGAACAERLPGRTATAVCGHARSLGVRCEHPGSAKKHAWTSSDHIDAEIRRAYTEGPAGAIRDLSRDLMRPRWWVQRRARKLGVMMPRFKEPDWSDAEIAIAGARTCQTPESVQRALARAGYKRTLTAVAVKMKRIGVSRSTRVTHEECCPRAVAEFLGVDPTVVTDRWLKNGWLKARECNTARLPQQGGDERRVRYTDLRRFLISYPWEVDLRKAHPNRVMLIRLLEEKPCRIWGEMFMAQFGRRAPVEMEIA